MRLACFGVIPPTSTPPTFVPSASSPGEPENASPITTKAATSPPRTRRDGRAVANRGGVRWTRAGEWRRARSSRGILSAQRSQSGDVRESLPKRSSQRDRLCRPLLCDGGSSLRLRARHDAAPIDDAGEGDEPHRAEQTGRRGLVVDRDAGGDRKRVACRRTRGRPWRAPAPAGTRAGSDRRRGGGSAKMGRPEREQRSRPGRRPSCPRRPPRT